jgi:ferritin-like metal-binding protein YciE
MATTKSKPSKEMKESKFHELFLHELKDIYWAENHLSKSLKKLSKAVTSEKLSTALDSHQRETENQIQRLEKAFELLDEKAAGKKCQAMEGLIEEAEEVLKDTDKDSMVRDAGVIIACQKVEHYEIASYGSLVRLAKDMGHDEVADLLAQTLNEEKKTDELLTQLAEKDVNQKAMKE